MEKSTTQFVAETLYTKLTKEIAYDYINFKRPKTI